MDFISPYDIIDISPSVVPDRQALLDARKTLFARLELSGETELEYKGRKYTRDGIEKLFEQYLADTNWKYYQVIEHDGRLKAFLKTSAYLDGFLSATLDYFTDPAFIAFAEKWYASSYQKYVLDLFESGRADKLKIFLAQKHPLSEALMNEVQFSIFISIEKMASEIRNLAEDKVAMNVKGLSNLWHYYDLKRIECLNVLPEFYDDLRDNYALALCDLFVTLNNDYRKYETCKVLIRNAKKLKLTDLAKAEVQRQYDFSTQEHGSSGLGIGKISWVIVAVVIAVIRLANNSCVDKDVHYFGGEHVTTVDGIQQPLLAEGEFMAQDLAEQGLIATPQYEIDKNFTKVFDFYAIQNGLPDTISTYHPIEESMLGYFNKIIPGCKNFSQTGEHSFTIDNQTGNDYLVFLLKEDGGVDFKHIAPRFNYTCFMNDPTARVYIIGGGKIKEDVVSRVTTTKSKRLPFIDCSDSRTSSYVIWDGFLSYRYGSGEGVTKILGKDFAYNIVITSTTNRATNIENRVKLIEH